MKDEILIKKLKNIRSSQSRPDHATSRKVRSFLVTIFPDLLKPGHAKSAEDYFWILRKFDDGEERIAMAIRCEIQRKKAGSNTTMPTSDQLFYVQNRLIKKLKTEVDQLIASLTEDVYPARIDLLIKDMLVMTKDKNIYREKLTIAERLQCLSANLDEVIPQLTERKPASTPGKKNDTYRDDFIRALTDTWIEITGLPPKRLTVNSSMRQGLKKDQFSEYIKQGIALFGRYLNPEEVARSAVEYYKERLLHYKKLHKLNSKKAKDKKESDRMRNFYRAEAEKFKELSKGL